MSDVVFLQPQCGHDLKKYHTVFRDVVLQHMATNPEFDVLRRYAADVPPDEYILGVPFLENATPEQVCEEICEAHIPIQEYLGMALTKQIASEENWTICYIHVLGVYFLYADSHPDTLLEISICWPAYPPGW